MADAALRDAERALLASPSDAETYARWVAAYLRSGGRDPRRDPRAGDVVEDARRVSGPRTVVGSWPMQTRSRIEAYGRSDELAAALGAPDGIAHKDSGSGWGAGTPRSARVTLAEGTLVRYGVDRESHGGRVVFRSAFDVRLGSPARCWTWVRVEGYYDILDHLAPAAGVHAAHPVYRPGISDPAGWTTRYTIEEGRPVELSSWRSWAKGGTVLRVAR